MSNQEGLYHSMFDGRQSYMEAISTEIFIGKSSTLCGASSEKDQRQCREYFLKKCFIKYDLNKFIGEGCSWNNIAFRQLSEWIARNNVYKDRVQILELHQPTSKVGTVVFEVYIQEGEIIK